jgi:hypothetical protein
VCNDSNPCTDDSCAPATGCVYVNDNTNSCSDGNLCTTGDVCLAGACIGTPLPEPVEVTDVFLDRIEGVTTVQWAAQPAGLHYDISGGSVLDLVPDNGVFAATCIGNDVAGTPYVDTRPDPPTDDGFYYLVRAQHVCRTGTYGTTSAGDQRTPTNPCP